MLLGRSWALWGHSWGVLGRSWAAFGRSWGTLGALLGSFWPLLGRLVALLRRIWAHLGPSWKHLGQNIEKTSRGTKFLRPFEQPKWRPKSSKIVLKKQCAFHDAILTFFAVVSHFTMPGDGDMCRANPYKTLAGRTKIEVRLGQAG